MQSIKRKGMLNTLKQVKEFSKTFNYGIFAFDTETTGLIFTLLEMEGLSLCDGETSCYIDLIDNKESLSITNYLKEKFEAANTLIAHNIVFDLKVIYKYMINPTCQLFDTMVADHLLDENRRHGLKFLAKTFLKVDTVAYEEAEKAGHQSKLFYEYAENDAIWTWQLAMLQLPQLKKQKLLPLFRDIEMKYQYVLLDMIINGVLIDKKKVSETTEVLIKAKQEVQVQMYKNLNLPYDYQTDLFGNKVLRGTLNFSSTQQLATILFKDLGLDVIEKTPTGAPSVGKLTIAKYKDTNDFVFLLNKYKIIAKLLSGFFEPLPKFIEIDGRIRPNFMDIGTATGRLSCSKPNLQQLPKANKDFPIETRACFVAQEGYTMVTCDYSGQELRVLAQVSKAKKMIEAITAGKDFHQETADTFGIPRSKAKAINFGIAYGKSAYGFAKDWDCSEQEAQEYLNKYFTNFPEVKMAMIKTNNTIDTYGQVSTITGRTRHFEKVTKGKWTGYKKDVYRKGFNFLIQGYSADMIRIASVTTFETSKKNPDWDLKQIASVHDENVYEVKTEYLDEACKAIKKDFEGAVKLCVPLESEIGIGANYAEAK